MNGEAWVKEAYDAILEGDFERAIACFERAIALDPGCASHHYKLSVTCSRSGRLKRALQAANQAVRLAPTDEGYRQQLNHVKALISMSQAKEQLDALKQEDKAESLRAAIRLLQNAVELDPLSTSAYLMLAAVFEEAGRSREALAAVEEALHLDPSHPEAAAFAARLGGKKLLH